METARDSFAIPAAGGRDVAARDDQLLANALRHYRGGRLDAAAEICRELVSRQPENHLALTILGVAACRGGRPDEGAAWFRRAVEANPSSAQGFFNLANALRDQGKSDEAVVNYRQALALDPRHAASHNNLGNTLEHLGRIEEAIACYRQATAAPDQYQAHVNLGNLLRDRGESEAAAQHYWQALLIKPDFAPAYNDVASTLWAIGRAAEAAIFYRRGAELAPDAHRRHAFYSNMLLSLQYDPAMTPGALLLEHRAFAAMLPEARPAYANQRDPDRPLHIGYVSPDLHQHPVGFLLTPILAAHDHANFAVHCYYERRSGDAITASLKKQADIWRVTREIDDASMAAMIRDDKVDILVDLAGHTANNRLPVFALRPAPVQVTWAGYEGTTGLDAIDYLLTDRWQSPPGSDRYAVEKLVALPDGYLCWAVPAHAPEVGPLPARAPGAVTFGCFNNLAKINPPVIALWGRLMRELPQSRLVLKAAALRDGAARERIAALFTVEGIESARVVLEDASPHDAYLRRHHDIDIALDPFPFCGGVTTVDALWMGVPVVTMPGERFASRHSLSHLSNAGLGELVADSPDAYIRTAKDLAFDLPRLAALRAGMRDRLRASPLLQATRFTRGLEAAFRAMWRAWCEQPG